MSNERIALYFVGSIIATQPSHINSESTFTAVSSITNSLIFFFLFDFFGLYFCIHFQIETWLIFTRCKKDNAFTAFLNDKPKNYKYNP
jgi:hypothetical protein